jgi:hypothetical protein
VKRTVDQPRAHIDQRVSGEHAVLHLLLDALVDRRNVFARNDAADDFVDEFVDLTFLSIRQRLDLELHVPILAAAAELPHEFAFTLGTRANRFAVCDPRLSNVGLNFEFAAHAVDDDVQGQLASASMMVWPDSASVCAKRRVVLRKFAERNAHHRRVPTSVLPRPKCQLGIRPASGWRSWIASVSLQSSLPSVDGAYPRSNIGDFVTIVRSSAHAATRSSFSGSSPHRESARGSTRKNVACQRIGCLQF